MPRLRETGERNTGFKGWGIALALLFAFLLIGIVTQTPEVRTESQVARAEARATMEARTVVTPGPDEILVGAYINDIHTVDLTTHSFPGDIYVWFRWTNPEFDPVETFEFMNLFDPEAHIEDTLYDEPQVMPDGSFYNIIRHQGAFSVPMNLARYPFDSQRLAFIIEDAEYGTNDVRYVRGPEGLTANREISLPGYSVGEPEEIIFPKSYPTIFGDISNPEATAYSRVEFAVPIQRPWQTGVIKIILPVVLIMLCAGLSLTIDPNNAEGRIGLVITALLTLVALQLTTSSSLPEVGYLMLIDQVYIICYAAILAILVQVARSTWFDENPDDIAMTARQDTRVLVWVGTAFIAALLTIVTVAFLR